MTASPGILPRRMRRMHGFTYLGVLVIVAIMGAGTAGWLQLWHVAQTRENERELLFIGQQFRQALASWYRFGRPGPHRLEELLADPRTPVLQRHLRRISVDPMTGRAEWGLVKDSDGGIVAVHSLSPAAPLQQAGFAARDRAFERSARYSDWVFGPQGGERAQGRQAPGAAGEGARNGRKP